MEIDSGTSIDKNKLELGRVALSFVTWQMRLIKVGSSFKTDPPAVRGIFDAIDESATKLTYF